VATKKRTKRKTRAKKPKLYILWNPESERPPRVMFDDEEKARMVAAIMARKHGETFYVMQAVCSVEQQPIPVLVQEY
jgi:hypothetical protein